MKFLPRNWCAFFLLTSCLATGLHAVEKARVNQPRVNVRGQAAMTSEVVTQLQKDEEVSILEEITIAKPKAGEPAKWAKIQMPRNTPVWVYAPLLKDRLTSSRKLNLRAGPGENYSVVGLIAKGEAIKEIRSLEDWVEIETPANAFAFLDAQLLTKSGVETPAPAVTPVVVTAPVAVVVPPPPVVVVPLATESLADVAVAIVVAEKPAPVKPAIVVAPVSELVPLAAVPAVVVPIKIVETSVSPVADPGPAPRRTVRREGTVRSTRFNIQAPTYYELVSSEGNIGINYLQGEKSGLKLRDFRGKKVVVSGEESIDPRYPSRPIMEIETIETAP